MTEAVQAAKTPESITVGTLILTYGQDGQKGTVTRGGKPINLGGVLFGYLAHLMRDKGEVVSEEMLHAQGSLFDRRVKHMPDKYAFEVVKVQIFKLRQALGKPNLISAVDHCGYRFSVDGKEMPLRVRAKGKSYAPRNPQAAPT